MTSRTVSLLRQYFEEFFKRYFLPADVCCIAGDIANNYFTYVEFLKFIATKYSAVYVCFGNHDIITERAGVFGTEKDFPTSEGKMDFFLKESAKIPNIHLLENYMEDGVAGCMGMCDFKYMHAPGTSEILNQMLWSTRWFDGRHWNYMRNNPKRLWEHYDVVLRELSLKKPKIMMSHFLPLEFGMAERYIHDPCSNFFYFHGAPYLENLDDGSIYQAGHTHTAIKKTFVDSQDKCHLLLCNPVGYPDENPYVENDLRREDFLIELDTRIGLAARMCIRGGAHQPSC